MPDPTAALQTLLRLRQTDPLINPTLQGNTSAAAFESMIPEEDLYQTQDALNDVGAARGGTYAIPSRESLRSNAGAKLRQTFGLKAADAEARMAPERIKGEYGLQQERLRGQTEIEKTKQAQAIAEANRQANTASAEAARQAAAERQQAGFKNAGERQASTQAFQRQMQTMPLRPKAPEPSGGGLLGFLGLGGNDASAINDEITTYAQQVMQANPGMAFDDLVSSGAIHPAEWSPDELDQLRQAVGE